METVTIPKEEYERLKQLEEVADDILAQLRMSAEDIKAGKIKKLA